MLTMRPTGGHSVSGHDIVKLWVETGTVLPDGRSRTVPVSTHNFTMSWPETE